jgi:4-deoxy-L-threo-5-hexosulose-uronate ketol-isomerase
MPVDVRYPTHPSEFDHLTPLQLRERFVLENLFSSGEVRLALSLGDRLVVGGAIPAGRDLSLPAPEELRCSHFLGRREVAIVCLAGSGTVRTDGAEHVVEAEDILYVGKGTQSVVLSGTDAIFYLVSAPAHQSLPTVLAHRRDAETVEVGDPAQASRRTLRKYVHEGGVASCELAVGITTLAEGSVWNTMPCHTHERRTEIYLYFGLAEDARVVHLCGRPSSTRSLILADRQAVISPPWSIHTGAGTQSYRFVWSTGGENLAYNDMDMVDTRDLR